jgi:hypothetical protein
MTDININKQLLDIALNNQSYNERLDKIIDNQMYIQILLFLNLGFSIQQIIRYYFY